MGFPTVGTVLLFTVAFLVLSFGIVGLYIVIPEIAHRGSLWFYFNYVFGTYLLVCIIFNYAMAAQTPPGCGSLVHDPCDHEQSYDVCKKCSKYRYPRSHHCNVCKACVSRMDHHCPWINNCVGLRNYRYYLCFVFWTAIATGYLSINLVPRVCSPESGMLLGERGIVWEVWLDMSNQLSTNNSMSAHSQLTQLIYDNNRWNDTVPANEIVSNGGGREDKALEVPIVTQSRRERHDRRNNWIHALARLYERISIRQAKRSDSNKVAELSYRTDYELLWSLAHDSWCLNSLLLVTLITAWIVCIGVSRLLIFHVQLVLLAETTIEHLAGENLRSHQRCSGGVPYKSPYDNGWKQNVHQVLGTSIDAIHDCVYLPVNIRESMVMLWQQVDRWLPPGSPICFIIFELPILLVPRFCGSNVIDISTVSTPTNENSSNWKKIDDMM